MTESQKSFLTRTAGSLGDGFNARRSERFRAEQTGRQALDNPSVSNCSARERLPSVGR